MYITRSMKEEVAIVGLGLYGATTALVVGLLVWLYSYRCCSEWNSHARRLPCFSPKNLFFFIIFSFLLCRLAWLAVDGWSPEHVSDYILNRVAFALFFTAFTLVIFFWADTLHAMRNTSEQREGVYDIGFFRSWKARAAFIAVNGFIYLGQVAFIVVFIVVDDHKREGRHAYNVNVLSVVAVFGLVCVAFLGYGIGLLVVTRRAMNTRRKLKFYLQTVVITVVLVVCFCARFAMFLYRPIADDYTDPWVFAALAYWVPELVPTVLMAVVLGLSLRRQMVLRYHTERLSTYSRFAAKGLAEPLLTHDSDDDDLIIDAALSAPVSDYDSDYDDHRYAINSS